MSRNRKTFNKSLIKEVWDKAKDFSNNPNFQKKLDYRKRIMYFPAYGDREHKYGWNIDHINRNPNDNNIANLRAVNFKTHEELNARFNKKHSKK
ncbi:MAG: HNH endonuclease [Mycoplasma sp.]|nr:HNH endonuclease [Mycoplasma sp.]